MYEFSIIALKDKVGIRVICPHCGNEIINKTMDICKHCFEPIPDALDVINNVSARVECYSEQPPWGY